MKSLTAITIISVAVMIMASAGYYFYNNSINESSYPSYHVDMHLNTTIPVPYYPIHVNSNLTGNGTYQQLLTFSDPSHYGINANGSNLAFYDGSNNTHLYAWIQSMNSTSMQVWVKNYNASNVIDMQVLPSYENLFNATGYLGEAPQLSPTYAEYDNGKYVFPVYYNFVSNTGNITIPSGAIYSFDNGLNYSSNTTGPSLGQNPLQTPFQLNWVDYSEIENVKVSVYNGSIGGGDVSFGGERNAFGSVQNYQSYIDACSDGLEINNYNGTFTGVLFSEAKNYNFFNIMWGSLSNSSTYAVYNGTTTYNTLSTEPNNINPLILYTYHTDYFILHYIAVAHISIPSMPTFTIGTFTNMTDHAVASYLSNSITIPMPNWFNLTLKAYTNYSFTFHYNNTPLYFTYDGLINNTIYTGFLDSNLTLDIHFIALGYSGKTELIVGR